MSFMYFSWITSVIKHKIRLLKNQHNCIENYLAKTIINACFHIYLCRFNNITLFLRRNEITHKLLLSFYLNSYERKGSLILSFDGLLNIWQFWHSSFTSSFMTIKNTKIVNTFSIAIYHSENSRFQKAIVRSYTKRILDLVQHSSTMKMMCRQTANIFPCLWWLNRY